MMTDVVPHLYGSRHPKLGRDSLSSSNWWMLLDKLQDCIRVITEKEVIVKAFLGPELMQQQVSLLSLVRRIVEIDRGGVPVFCIKQHHRTLALGIMRYRPSRWYGTSM